MPDPTSAPAASSASGVHDTRAGGGRATPSGAPSATPRYPGGPAAPARDDRAESPPRSTGGGIPEWVIWGALGVAALLLVGLTAAAAILVAS